MENLLNKEDLPMFLTIPQVADLLSISRAGAYALAHTPGFPVITIGKRLIVPRDDLFDYLDSMKQPVA